MPECPSPSAISQWLPVIAALAGATVVFIGGLLNLRLTHRSRESVERENRERDRLESLYETLVEIRMDYQGLLGEMISKVHFNTPPKPKAYSRIPPLIQLDMAIHMYLPSLLEAHKTLVSALEPFGRKWADNVSTSFSGHSTQDKQKICGEYAMLLKEIDSEISNLQRQLAGMAKA